MLAVLFGLYWQAYQPAWRGHLEIDTWNYWLKVEDFVKTGSLETKIGNEILPATTLFLLIPSFFISKNPFFYSNYLPVFFALILLTLVYQVFLAFRTKQLKNTAIFLLLMFSFGPILLFRFDALAALLAVLSLLAFSQKKYSLSGWWLGLVTSIKVYPIIFLPYLLWLLVKQQKKAIRPFLAAAIFGGLLPIFIFLLFGGQVHQIIEGLNFHSQKFVSIESLPGSLITAWSVLTKAYPPQLLGGWGVWGIPAPLNFFNNFWLIPIFGFYFYLYRAKKLRPRFNWEIIFCLMLLFLVFSKNLHAQYIWWFLCFYPWLKVDVTRIVLLFFINVFNQLVYPLFYTQFYQGFYQYNQDYPVFYALLIRNFLIVLLLLISLKHAVNKK